MTSRSVSHRDPVVEGLHRTVVDLVTDVPQAATLSALAELFGRHMGCTAPVVVPYDAAVDEPVAGSGGRQGIPIAGLNGRVVGRLDAEGRQPRSLDDTGRQLLDLMGLVIERHRVRRRRAAAVAAERERIAGQLHDDSVQAMTAVGLVLQRIQRKRGDDDELRGALDDAHQLVVDAANRIRHMMFALHPPTLAVDGLAVSLSDYLEAFVQTEGLTCTIDGDIELDLPVPIAGLAFRLARGAIHNVVKHAAATHLDVLLRIDDGTLVVTITDDGEGFEVDAALEPVPGHAGIPYARELAAEYGGSYELESSAGTGTTVTISLPLR